MPSTIGFDQNQPSMLHILKARFVTYRRAGLWQRAQIALIVLLPFCASIASILYPPIRPYSIATTVIVTLLDVLILDREYRACTKMAARIGELFDTKLFGLPWCAVAAGAAPSAEAISRLAKKWSGEISALVDRYPTAVDIAPLHVARTLCQRSVVWYDSELRRGFGSRLAILGVLLFATLTVLGLMRGLVLADWLVSVLAPSAPIFIWIIRERYRQLDATETNERIAIEAERLLEDIFQGRCGGSALVHRSRELQTGILTRRMANPWVPRWLYVRLRPDLEPSMRRGTEEWLARLGYPIELRSE